MGQSCPPGACGVQTHTGKASRFRAPRFMSQPPQGSRACSPGQCFSGRNLEWPHFCSVWDKGMDALGPWAGGWGVGGKGPAGKSAEGG